MADQMVEAGGGEIGRGRGEVFEVLPGRVRIPSKKFPDRANSAESHCAVKWGWSWQSRKTNSSQPRKG